MAQTKKSAEDKAEVFNPSALSLEAQEKVVEQYLGVHPKYFLYRGLNIQLNHGQFRHDGLHFNGWKPKSNKYNSTGE
jgi:hypothetical protein